MNSEPKEYISLDGRSNFAFYKCANPAVAGRDVMTRFPRARLNVPDLSIMLGDYKFAEQSGDCRVVLKADTDPVDFMLSNVSDLALCGPTGLCGPIAAPLIRYGTAAGCTLGGDHSGFARVDLRGSNFKLDVTTTAWDIEGKLSNGVCLFPCLFLFLSKTTHVVQRLGWSICFSALLTRSHTLVLVVMMRSKEFKS